jgi:hypothetical protein
MLIAFAKVCYDKGIDYQRKVLFVGQDIDSVVARMCYISLTLLGCAGCVVIGNTLLVEVQEVLYTPVYFFEGFQWKERKKRAELKGEASQVRNAETIVECVDAPVIQLSLFDGEVI